MKQSLKNLEKRDDGKFEVIDVKLDNRKTKSLDPNNKNLESTKIDIVPKNQGSIKVKNVENLIKSSDNKSDKTSTRFSMPDRRKVIFKKQLLVIIRYIYTLENTRMEKLVRFLSIPARKVN